MNFALIGATGMVGSRLLAEALARGHHVTAVVRDPGKLSPKNNLKVVKGDATDATALASLLKGQELVVSAYNAERGSPTFRESVLNAYDAIRRAAKSAGVKRLIGGDQLLTDAKGNSKLSAEDFAIALIDEVEQPKHVRRRFSVAY